MSQISDLISPLHKATMEQKVSWKLEGEARIWTTQGSGVLEILEVSPNGAYNFVVRNKDGVTLDSEMLVNANPKFVEISQIFKKTKRSFLNVDKIIDDIKEKIVRL